ncbi:hypothetical protein [Chitinophaga caseinilytica]|uniref:DUF4410 domain-containing protein n=1 Tax=Chitinophaga caseinilytica TaxID=2267521 RepID=A0ABZ2Z8A5_9BACT
MRSRTLLFLFPFLALCALASAQKIDISSGKIDALKGIDTFQIIYKYDKLMVGDLGRESNYIRKKKADAEKRAPGSGYAWEEMWIGDRSKYYEPQFLEAIRKFSEKEIGDHPGTRYQLVLSSTYIEPGQSGLIRKSAKLKGTITVIDTQNPTKPLVKIQIDEATGESNKEDNGTGGPRIGAAYAKAGKELGNYLRQRLD